MQGLAQFQTNRLLVSPKTFSTSFTRRLQTRSMASDVAGGGVVVVPRQVREWGDKGMQASPQCYRCGLPADPSKAFISQFRLEGSKEGPLAGCTLAVKDLFDVSDCTASEGRGIKQQLLKARHRSLWCLVAIHSSLICDVLPNVGGTF